MDALVHEIGQINRRIDEGVILRCQVPLGTPQASIGVPFSGGTILMHADTGRIDYLDIAVKDGRRRPEKPIPAASRSSESVQERTRWTCRRCKCRASVLILGILTTMHFNLMTQIDKQREFLDRLSKRI
ncbi:MAG: hypothetical protein CMH13_21355 [Martelella sp.]|uniref:hypothetical protein n=1 Tax=unclassified Martelella TaxID=2629616 RepID=UPI000C3E0156|nr:hypothetical protein [Martelella sp.]MAU23052.1 hypothetical protein [Martelella sp.]|tara:strand:+ start:538 stop:924 length:387 start_codon:yes stop_codon:yes gene_type:complete